MIRVCARPVVGLHEMYTAQPHQSVIE